MEEKKVTLGGFDAILDTVIPNYQKEENIDDPANTEDDVTPRIATARGRRLKVRITKIPG